MPTKISDKEAKRAEARAGLARAKQWRDERRDSKSPIIKKKKSNQSGAPESSSSTKKKKSAPTKRTPSKAKKVAVAEEAPAEATTYRKTPSREDRAKAREKARQWSSNRSNRKHTNISKNAAAVVEEEDIGIPKVVETKNSDNGTNDSDDFKTAADTESKTAVVSSYDLKEIQCMKSDMKSICTRFGILSDKFAENLGISGHEKNDKDDSDAMDCE